MSPAFPGRRYRSVILRGVGVVSSVLLGHAGASQPPVIPGLDQRHPLSEEQAGEVLMSELRCAACHEGMQGEGMKLAPDLRKVGSRLNGDYLRRFIADPSGVHPGTTMPSLIAGESEEARRATSEALTSYLLSLQEPQVPVKATAKADANAGREAYHALGCVACHSPRDAEGKELSRKGDVSLIHLAGKYQPNALAEFLLDPLKVRPSGRMPDMGLSRSEAADLAAYLTNGHQEQASDIERPRPEQVAIGKEAFKRLNCAACHQMDESEMKVVRPGPPLAKLDPLRGCLSETPKSAPDFHLSEAQRKSIRSALARVAEPRPEADRIRMKLTQLNCIACHVREDFGGAAPDRDSYLHSTEPALGNEARIPPPLTGIGAKLRPEWLNRVLHDRERVRPYMQTRMPHYGEVALKGLSDWLVAVDHPEPAVHKSIPPDPDEPSDPDELSAQDRELRKRMRSGALELLGDKGLNCISCHNFNGTESQGMKGLDLMTSYQRLRPEWFRGYMRNPAAFRPGIIMPNYWPDGKATQTAILDGDAKLQIEALWDTFSLGRSARDPSGLRSADIKLTVGDQPVLKRGRSRIAGFRGIAVGFPGGMNYAFNAQSGTLSALWKGEFVNVNWKSQGAGDFSPAAKAMALAQDVSFLRLDDEKSPWPLMPVTSKEQPVNPDPLYPRKHGYAFVGYALDAALNPVFTYRCGDITIEDKPVPASSVGPNVLRRTFTFSSPVETTLHFRALTGKIESESPTIFKTPEIRVSLSQGETMVRPSTTGDVGQELLVRLRIPKGNSSFTVDYALLP